MDQAQFESLLSSFRKEIRQKLNEMNEKLDHLIQRAHALHGPCDTTLNEFGE